jgi:uracil-DNA glycosylase
MERPEKKLADMVSYMFRDISPAWKRILLHETAKPLFTTALRELRGRCTVDQCIPHPAMILEAFRYAEPDKISCVIVAQDPYPRPWDACGMSFSCIGERTPSIGNIYAAAHQTANTADLRRWAQQGVLLLNRYLTRDITMSDKAPLHTFWEDYTRRIVELLIEVERPFKLSLLLWGKPAATLASYPMIRERAEADDVQILLYGHPSPANTSCRFAECRHFEMVNLELAKCGMKIDWSPEPRLPRITVAVDGGCVGNGKKEGAKSACAGVWFLPGMIEETGIAQRLYPCRVNWAIGQGVVIDNSTDQMLAITNNRAELLSLALALDKIVKWYRLRPGRVNGITIIADSEYLINTAQCSVWKDAPSEVDCNSGVGKTKKGKILANPDLLATIRAAFLELALYLPPTRDSMNYTGVNAARARLFHPQYRKWDAILSGDTDYVDPHWTGILFCHVRSHQPPPSNPNVWIRWNANQQADRLTNSA